MALAQQLIEQSSRHQVFLERLKSGEVNQFEAFLREIDNSIRKRLESKDLTSYTRTRLEILLTSVEKDLNVIYAKHYDQLEGSLIDLAQYEAEFESRSLNEVLTNFETVIPTASQVSAAVFSKPLSVRGIDGGKLLKPFIKDWSANEVKRVSGVIRQGFFEGQTTSQIVQRVRGTRANQYRDGILAISNRNAQTIVRTAVQHAATVAREQTWQSNSNVITGVRWISTLDGRTSQQCRSLDQHVFALNKGPRPPLHMNCRSTIVPELDGRFDFLREGATRASKDGYVDANQTYYDWLKKQPTRFQEAAIGKARAKLLRDGGLTAERFAELNLGRNFEPLSLEQMKAIEPLAFERAFGVIEYQQPATKTVFEEFSNTVDAAQWVVTRGYVSAADYGKVDIRVANEVNRSLYDHMEDYPELKGSFSFVGSAQTLHRNMYEAQLKYYRQIAVERYPDRDPDKLAKAWAKRPKTSGEWAFAQGKSSHSAMVGMDGIAFNEKFSTNKGFNSLLEGLKRSLDSGFHPTGCDTVKSIMDHEMGHQIDYLLGISKDNEVIELWREWGGNKDTLSGYARKNIAEFIAESWAEYRNNKKPRDIAKRLGDIIDARYRTKYGNR